MASSDLGHGKVVIITGAGRGIGRSYALLFARHGFRVVVNDLGVDVHGENPHSNVAEEVAEEIRQAGGIAISNGDDVADWDGAAHMIQSAIDEFGRLDVLVNNAGILRDGLFLDMSPEDWDAIMYVHLRGTFCPSRHAANYWKELAEQGAAVDGRIINTTSNSGLIGNPSQSNYGAAKAGIAAFTIIAAEELEPYGIMVNAVAPAGLSRMVDHRPQFQKAKKTFEENPDAWVDLHADNAAPTVIWLATEAAAGITGRVVNALGGRVQILEPWTKGPVTEKEGRWELSELDEVIPRLLSEARPRVRKTPLVPIARQVGPAS